MHVIENFRLTYHSKVNRRYSHQYWVWKVVSDSQFLDELCGAEMYLIQEEKNIFKTRA